MTSHLRHIPCISITVAATLTPWELWLVRKTEDERKKIEKEQQEKVGLFQPH